MAGDKVAFAFGDFVPSAMAFASPEATEARFPLWRFLVMLGCERQRWVLAAGQPRLRLRPTAK